MSKTAPAVRFVEEGDDWFVEGLILPFGGPLNGQDLTGTHFTKSTDFCLGWHPDGGRPGLYAHGFDPSLGLSVVGREVKHWKDDKGIWLRAQIDKAHEYAGEIKQLVDDGLVSLSSGAIDHLVRVSSKSGEITTWPWVEWSIVPNPAHPGAVLYPVKSADAIEHLKEVGTDPVIEITDAVKSEAADDAAQASVIRAQLAQILADEVGEGDQETVLRRAIALIDRFISAETDEIGGETDTNTSVSDDMGAFLSVDRVVKSLSALTPQALHDASLASGAKCVSEATKAEPVITVTATVDDLDSLLPRLDDLAAKTAQAAVKERLTP
jgi:hypothetical protein